MMPELERLKGYYEQYLTGFPAFADGFEAAVQGRKIDGDTDTMRGYRCGKRWADRVRKIKHPADEDPIFHCMDCGWTGPDSETQKDDSTRVCDECGGELESL